MSGDTSLGDVLSDVVVNEVAEEVVEHDTGASESATPADDQVEQEQGQQEDPIEKHRKGLEAGIAAERKRRQEVEAKAAQLEAELQRLKQPIKQAQTDAIVRPKRDEFATQEEYEDALLEYGDKRREHQAEQKRQEQQAQEHAQQVQRTADEVVTKGQQAFQDFDTVINSGLGPYLAQETPQALVFKQALVTTKRAHEVAYYLGKHPEEAQRIYALPPLQMVDEIAEIRLTKLDAATEQTAQQNKPFLPQTLTQARDARTGQFQPKQYDGPTPLDDVLATKR
jgi:hypothetical protein